MKRRLFTILAISLAFSLQAQQSSLERNAQEWIKQHSTELGMKQHQQLKLSFTRQSPSGETLRYQQFINDVPVFESELVLHFNTRGQVTFSTESLNRMAENISVTPSISVDQALSKAKENLGLVGEIIIEEAKLYVFVTEDAQTKLAYRTLHKSYATVGLWETMVDAVSGEIIRVKDVAMYHKHDHGDNDGKKKKTQKQNTKKNTLVTGTAYIFNPDPLSATGSTYGGQYVDGNDATNDALDAARTLVTIPELEFSNGQYKLKSQYAEIRDFASPSTGLFLQNSPDFLFNRNEQGFEAINAYWHINNSLIYINDELQIPLKSIYNNGVVLFDPHGAGGDDNSYYGGGRLEFGEGCVDDAEDADVILHELGHGLHDWVTNGASSQVNGLSEGSGDYWAQSYSRSLNQWDTNRPQYHWVFSWDGHNPCWPGRTTNYAATYPGGLIGSIHSDGQIWATSLMRIWDRIGRTKTDAIFLEGLGMTTYNTNQQNAAIAVRQAAIDLVDAGLYGMTCGDVEIITEEFTTTGYNLPDYECEQLAVPTLNTNNISVYPNPTSDVLNVKMNFDKNYKIGVYDLSGKQLFNSQIDAKQNSINVAFLPKGIYVLKIEGTSFVYKFVKS